MVVGHSDTELDRIRLSGIEVMATHGVYPEEKIQPQLFRIDLTCSLRPRPDADDLTTTVDYADLTAKVVKLVQQDTVDLIETLAERISSLCLSDPRIAVVEVSVHKPSAALPAPVADVAVTITRRSLT